MRARIYRRRRARADGFVLIAVLAVLIILSVLGASVGVITQRLRDQQLERQRQLRAEIAMTSTRATVLYLLTSQRMTFGGLTVDDRVVLTEDQQRERQLGEGVVSTLPVGNEVAMDGSVHRGFGNTRFALQDDRGLLAVNWAPPALLEAFVGADRKKVKPISTLMSLLLDYQDPDDLYRLNSAERQAYELAGRAPPSNRSLVTPLELRRIIGWDAALADLTDVDLVNSIAVIRSSHININTAPARVLRTLPGVDKAMAERLIAVRSVRPFTSEAEYFQLVGALTVDEELLSLYPMPSGTLKLWSPEGGPVEVLHWTLTPRADGGRPWREDYEFILPGDQATTRGPARVVAAKVFAEPDASPQ